MGQEIEPVYTTISTVELTCEQFIKFQLMFYSYVKGIVLSRRELNALTLLGLKGEQPLLGFCQELVARKIFMSVQSVRNALGKMEDNKLISKTGGHKKSIVLSDTVGLHTQKNTKLTINCIYR